MYEFIYLSLQMNTYSFMKNIEHKVQNQSYKNIITRTLRIIEVIFGWYKETQIYSDWQSSNSLLKGAAFI